MIFEPSTLALVSVHFGQSGKRTDQVLHLDGTSRKAMSNSPVSVSRVSALLPVTQTNQKRGQTHSQLICDFQSTPVSSHHL